MKAMLKARLTDIGISLRKYTIDYDGVLRWDDQKYEETYAPEIWGTELCHDRHGKLYIDHQGDQYGGNRKFYLRTRQGDGATTLGSFKRQQDAIAAAITRWFL